MTPLTAIDSNDSFLKTVLSTISSNVFHLTVLVLNGADDLFLLVN